jgi:hypothetical protein
MGLTGAKQEQKLALSGSGRVSVGWTIDAYGVGGQQRSVLPRSPRTISRGVVHEPERTTMNENL